MRKLLLLTAGVAATALTLGFGGVYTLSELELHNRVASHQFATKIPTDSASIKHGRHIARTRGCFGCHGQQLQGVDFGEQWDFPKRAVAPNLAKYAREHDPQTIEAAIRQGIGADGRELMSMPSYNFARLRDDDLAALIAFLRAAPIVEVDLPRPALGWDVRWDIARGEELSMADWVEMVPPLRLDPVEQPVLAEGEYLAMTMCNECHGLDLRGESYYNALDGAPATPDLAVVAAYDREQFETLIESGSAPGGRRLGLMALVGPDRFPSLSDSELDSLHAYLQSLVGTPRPEVFWRP
ncbi:MAG: c-type cytochrome [Pseudomonadota bacterium]